MKPNPDCDVLIIGAGATGSLAATVLAQAGLDVVCLEQGSWVEPGDHPHYSSDWTWQRRTNWNSDVKQAPTTRTTIRWRATARRC